MLCFVLHKLVPLKSALAVDTTVQTGSRRHFLQPSYLRSRLRNSYPASGSLNFAVGLLVL
jgi:hypothetical protein